MNDIDDSVEISAEPCCSPLSSLVPKTPQSSSDISDLSLTNNSSATIHFGAQKSKRYLILLESEPPVKVGIAQYYVNPSISGCS